jgi:hypothetical protein
MTRVRLSWSLFLVALICGGVIPTNAARAEGKKYAFLVGINKYDHPEPLPALRYAENDVIALAEVLRANGYRTEVLTDTAGKKDKALKPTKANIQAKLAEQLKKCTAGDVLIFGLSGHGVYFKDESYFCPQDAKPTLDKEGMETLLSLKTMYDHLGASKAAKVLLIDACRNDPKDGKGLTEKTTPPPPKNSVALFSCSIGEVSWEVDEYEHGVFFYHIIEGLKGKVQKNTEGNITWDRLQEYVRTEVPRAVPKLVVVAGQKIHQEPTRVGEESGTPLVLVHFGTPNETTPAKGYFFAFWEPDSLWYPGTIDKEEGGKVLVRFLDGDTQWLEKAKTGRFALAAGDRVYGNWKDKGTYYAGAIGQIDGDKIRINYDDGDTEDTTLKALRMNLDNPAMRKAGMRVMAYWQADGHWYPAEIKEIKDGSCKVLWDDGISKWLEPNQVSRYTIKTGDKVQGNWKNGGLYFRGKVTSKKDKEIHIVYDDGDEEDTTIDMVRMDLQVKLPIKP